MKTGHVVSDITLSRIKDRLSLVKGSLVECPLVSDSSCIPNANLIVIIICRTF